MSTPYPAIDVARFFVNKANSIEIDNGIVEGVSNLKLQKLLYFAQAAHLSIKDKPLFNDKIEAWEFGPVVRDVYNCFKAHDRKPVPNQPESNLIDSDTKEFLENTWDIFGKFSAAELVSLSHKHKPWIDAYHSSDKTISVDVMKAYYKNVFIPNAQ